MHYFDYIFKKKISEFFKNVYKILIRKVAWIQAFNKIQGVREVGCTSKEAERGLEARMRPTTDKPP